MEDELEFLIRVHKPQTLAELYELCSEVIWKGESDAVQPE